MPGGGFTFTRRLPVLAGRLTEIPGRLTGFSVTAFVVPVALTVFCLSAAAGSVVEAGGVDGRGAVAGEGGLVGGSPDGGLPSDTVIDVERVAVGVEVDVGASSGGDAAGVGFHFGFHLAAGAGRHVELATVGVDRERRTRQDVEFGVAAAYHGLARRARTGAQAECFAAVGRERECAARQAAHFEAVGLDAGREPAS